MIPEMKIFEQSLDVTTVSDMTHPSNFLVWGKDS